MRRLGRNSATDPEIVDAIKLLAQTEGIFTEPAGATLASAIKLIQQGRIPKNESICICITGNGWKCIESVQDDLEDLNVIEPNQPMRLMNCWGGRKREMR